MECSHKLDPNGSESFYGLDDDLCSQLGLNYLKTYLLRLTNVGLLRLYYQILPS